MSPSSDSEERNLEEPNPSVQSKDCGSESSDSSDGDSCSSTTPPPGIIPASVDPGTISISKLVSKSAPIVSSALSSTISKWVSKTANNTNDQGTRQLLSQLASVVPLGSSSMTGNAGFKEAQKEVLRGLKKPRDADPSSSISASVQTKGKGKKKVQHHEIIHLGITPLIVIVDRL